jgi:hypothetical protein
MHRYSPGCAGRAVGRLFSKEGKLHLVLDIDAERAVAKVSRRLDQSTEVVEMAVSEVIERLGSGSTLKLDGLNSEQTEHRIFSKDGEWYFKAREGEYGPYADKAAAKRALERHILLAQEEGRTGRPKAAAGN